jgi:tRNA(Ile)-lysidine synthase TilS/MesJ
MKNDPIFYGSGIIGSDTVMRDGAIPKENAINRFTGLVRRCVEDYKMIEAGETIAVGVSGGKDSIALICALVNLQLYYPKPFDLHAVTLDMGYEETDFLPVAKLCEKLKVPYTVRRTDIADVVFNKRREKNPCSLCAKMRRGALHDMIKDLGIRKIALAHHFDDAIETFMLSLLYEGRIYSFQPVTYMNRADVTQIRPMMYIGEGTIINLVEKYSLPVVNNPCRMNGASKREEIKTLIKTLSANYPDFRNKVFGAMQRLPLAGWEPGEYARRPLP